MLYDMVKKAVYDDLVNDPETTFVCGECGEGHMKAKFVKFTMHDDGDYELVVHCLKCDTHETYEIG